MKLRQLELKSGMTAQQRREVKVPAASTATAGLDPITKVSNWRQATPSCYGSGSVDADSSAPTKTHNGEEEDEDDSSDCSPPGGGGGFDSGYPGSDRSGVNRTGRSGSLGFGNGGGGRRTILGNVLEEEVSARCDETESSIPSEYATKPPPPPNIGVFHIVAPEDDSNQVVEEAVDDGLLQPPGGRQHLRGVLHSITDLSSDERSMFDRSDRSTRSAAGGGLSSPHILRNPPPASSTPRSPTMQPPPLSSALTTGRQPAVLAEQECYSVLS